MINAAQVRAARGLIGWSQDELAAQADVSVSLIRNMERALEAGGAVFVDANGLAPGARLLGV